MDLLIPPESDANGLSGWLSRVFGLALVLVVSGIVAVGWPDAPPVVGLGTASAAVGGPIQPIPFDVDVDPQEALLGERLFNDTRLSGDETISCASCHDLTRGGADGLQVSVGVGGALGPINAPTVFNAAYNFRQFWDGRAEDLEAQAALPVTNPLEMGADWDVVLERLAADADYPAQFELVYDGAPTQARVVAAIAAFERTLVTPNGRFDRYLRGDTNALVDQELEGWRAFREKGCVSCHQGVGVGGNMYQTFGVMGSYFTARGTPLTDADLGLFVQTGNEIDRHRFKVPSLRNVAETAPYFHDGSIATLEGAVEAMGRYQLGVELSPTEIADIAAFLTTLSGEYQGRAL